MAAKKKQKGRKKKTSKAAVVLTILAIALFVSGGMMAYAYDQDVKKVEHMRQVVEVDTFYAGISVGGIDLSGKTYEQGREAVMAADAEKLASFQAVISVDGREWKENLRPISDAQDALDKAYRFGRAGDLEVRYNEIQTLEQTKRDYPIDYSADTSRLSQLVNSIGDEIDVEPVDANVVDFDQKTKSFSFSDESAGRKLNREKLLADIENAIASETYPILATGAVEVIEPAVTRAQLGSNYKLIGSFSTTTTSDTARNNNITLCSEAFNGAKVMPGEVFSLNDATGRRSIDKGYREAGAIKNGKLIPEFGGGVCQVSTTLFNAVVRSGLEITERNNHSYPISYVERGMDAMIDYPSKDFKFTNNTAGPVYLVSHFADRKLTIEVYGQPVLEGGVTIELRADTTETIKMPATEYILDPTLPAGVEEEERAGRTGYRVTTYIRYMRGDTLVEEKVLFKSAYVAYAPQVRRGTAQTYVPPATGGDLPVIY